MVDFDVVDLGPTDHVESGETAPDFTRPLVNDEFWEDRSLADLAADGGAVLVFTPMIGSFPATYVWSELAERGWDGSDRSVVGCSIATPYATRDFVAERDRPFELFSDPGNGVAESFGIVHDLDGMSGVAEPRPAVFVLDEELIVEHAWVATEWPEFPDYDELESTIE